MAGDIEVCGSMVFSIENCGIAVSSSTYDGTRFFQHFDQWYVFGKHPNFVPYFGDGSFLTKLVIEQIFLEFQFSFRYFETEILWVYGFGDSQCPPPNKTSDLKKEESQRYVLHHHYLNFLLETQHDL